MSGRADERTSRRTGETTNGQADERTRSVQGGWAARRSFDKLSMTLRVETKRPRDRETKRGGVRNDKTTSGRADKRTSGQTDKRPNRRTTSWRKWKWWIYDREQSSDGGKENFVDKSLLFSLNLLSLHYTMQLTRTK